MSPDKTIDALFAFTNCEQSISPLGCVIEDNKPLFVGVSEMLRQSTEHTVELLKADLEIKLDELETQWHFASLERIFIEERIYRDIEEESTWDGVIAAIDAGLKPHIEHLKREVTTDDIVKLTEIKIKRISKFDSDKANQRIEAIEGAMAEVKHHLSNLVTYAINYFKKLKTDYGKDKERKTELRIFDDVDATKVVNRNTKLFVNREEGFVGTALKKDEYVCDCSDIDDIIIFTQSGQAVVTKVDGKTFVGKDIIHVAVFKKKDNRTIYNMIYRDGKSGPSYVKRFAVTAITRDKVYDLTSGSDHSEVLYFSANPNGEAEVVTVLLRQVGQIKKLKWDIDFSDIIIKGRESKGNLVTKNSVKRIELKEKGVSTLKPRKIWYDEVVRRLNTDERGELLGAFSGEDRLLVIEQSGIVKTITPDLTTHFSEDMIVLEQWIPEKPISIIYFDGEKERYFLKRFYIENENKPESVITDHPNSHLEMALTDWRPMVDIEFVKERGKDRRDNLQVDVESFIAVKGIKALGNQLTTHGVKSIDRLDPLPFVAPERLIAADIEVIDDVEVDYKTDNQTGQIDLFS